MIELDCKHCVHCRPIKNDALIRCAKPVPHMEGEVRGLEEGWFDYPVKFDPTWALSECANYEKEK